MTNWNGKKVIIVGAGRQGLAATRYLVKQGAEVTLTDKKPESEMKPIKEALHGMPVKFVFGAHPLELLEGADALCLSGGVPLTIPLVVEAKKQEIPLTNDSQLFMESVKANVIGITGSAGKTTTTILTGAIAKAALEPKVSVWVGGNIGYPMIEHAGEVKPEDWVVLELSSFQLEQMTISPNVAVILNITPNHLDRHTTMQAYKEAKARILAFQHKDDTAILNRDDPGVSNLRRRVNGCLITFGFSDFTHLEPSIFIEDGFIHYKDGKSKRKLIPTSALKLPGKHNLANAMAACAVAAKQGFDPQAIELGIASVKSIPHRLEFVREKDGIRWYNDSIATTPERVMAAIQSMQTPIVLLLGGRDKNLPWEALAELLHITKPKIILFGEAADLIQYALEKYEQGIPIYPLWKVDTLEQAVKKAAEEAKDGESVLLSPGGTSFDAYEDFEARGNHFKQLVENLK